MVHPEHYFSATPGGEIVYRTISVELAGQRLDLTTSNGIFSPERVDAGTQVLLGNVPAPPPGGNLLDLGCGWGPIALTLALESPRATVWAVDVNERALDLVRANAQKMSCLLYTSDAADEEDSVDLGGRRIIKK